MRMTIIGATGMIGSEMTAEAVRRGHDVTAASRRPTDPASNGVTSVAVDAGDPVAVGALLDAADFAILTIRPAPGFEDTLATTTRTVLDQSASTRTPVLVVGGAGALRRPDGPGRLLDDPRWVPAPYRTIAMASTRQLEICRDHRADWTYLSPPAEIGPGERTGVYVRGTDTLLTSPEGSTSEGARSFISVADFAIAALDEVENPSGTRHFTVACR